MKNTSQTILAALAIFCNLFIAFVSNGATLTSGNDSITATPKGNGYTVTAFGKVTEYDKQSFQRYWSTMKGMGWIENNTQPIITTNAASSTTKGFMVKARHLETFVVKNVIGAQGTPAGSASLCDVINGKGKQIRILWINMPHRSISVFSPSAQLNALERNIAIGTQQYKFRLNRLEVVRASTPDAAIGNVTGYRTVNGVVVGNNYNNPAMHQIELVNKETAIVNDMARTLETAERNFDRMQHEERESHKERMEYESKRTLSDSAYYIGKHDGIALWATGVTYQYCPANTEPPIPE